MSVICHSPHTVPAARSDGRTGSAYAICAACSRAPGWRQLQAHLRSGARRSRCSPRALGPAPLLPGAHTWAAATAPASGRTGVLASGRAWLPGPVGGQEDTGHRRCQCEAQPGRSSRPALGGGGDGGRDRCREVALPQGGWMERCREFGRSAPRPIWLLFPFVLVPFLRREHPEGTESLRPPPSPVLYG